MLLTRVVISSYIYKIDYFTVSFLDVYSVDSAYPVYCLLFETWKSWKKSSF